MFSDIGIGSNFPYPFEVIGILDLMTLSFQWLETGITGYPDLSGDGKVNFIDFAIISDN